MTPKKLLPDPINPEALPEHTRLVDTVTAAGIAPPDTWTQLRQRLSEFTKMSAATPLLERLVDALLDEPDADLPALRAATLAEQLDQVKIFAPVRHSVLARLRAIYAKAALGNYAKLVELFDAQADRFVATTRLVDVETPAVGVVDQSDRCRKAWLDAERESLRISALIAPLHAAAQLTGRVLESAGRDLGGRNAVLIPLCVNVSDLHRRRLWEAAASEGRCGRWSALVALGARIRGYPAAELDTFEPYRPAKPMEQRFEPVAVGISTRYLVDPEDANYQPAEPAKKPRLGRLAP